MGDAISMEHQVEQETKTSVPSLALTTQNPPMASFITVRDEARRDEDARNLQFESFHISRSMLRKQQDPRGLGHKKVVFLNTAFIPFIKRCAND